MIQKICISLLLSTIFFYSPSNADTKIQGKFLDELVLKGINDGRYFQLINKFRYLDPAGITWIVPVNERVNGASIPPILWSLVGGPWSGKYRRASVIHDYFFRTKKYASESVHRVFYDAMLTGGVSTIKAKLMYYAVLRFNDRWERQTYIKDCGTKINCYPILEGEEPPVSYSRISIPYDENDLKNAEQRIETENLSIKDIEKLAKNNLKQANK